MSTMSQTNTAPKKVLIIGESTVGKTSIMTSYFFDRFEEERIESTTNTIRKKVVELPDFGDSISL